MADASTAILLFVDLMNPGSESKQSLSLPEYDEMITDFEKTLSLVTSFHMKDFGYAGEGKDSEWSITGDELQVFLYSGDLRYDVCNALILAIKLKIGWLTSVFNQKIFMEGRPVSRLSVGIDCGSRVKDIDQSQYHINDDAILSTKRIESLARGGTGYQVMVGDSFHQACNEDQKINVTFRQVQGEIEGGQEKTPSVYEVVSFINYEIVPTMPHSIKDRVMEVMEYTVVKPAPEPWIYFILLRYYISKIIEGEQEEIASKAIKLANQALKVLEHKKTLYNILGWLHTYCDSLMDLNKGLHYFQKVLELEPNNLAALLHCARISEKRRTITSASESFEDILRRDPDRIKKKPAEGGVPQIGKGLWD